MPWFQRTPPIPSECLIQNSQLTPDFYCSQAQLLPATTQPLHVIRVGNDGTDPMEIGNEEDELGSGEDNKEDEVIYEENPGDVTVFPLYEDEDGDDNDNNGTDTVDIQGTGFDGDDEYDPDPYSFYGPRNIALLDISGRPPVEPERDIGYAANAIDLFADRDRKFMELNVRNTLLNRQSSSQDPQKYGLPIERLYAIYPAFRSVHAFTEIGSGRVKTDVYELLHLQLGARRPLPKRSPRTGKLRPPGILKNPALKKNDFIEDSRVHWPEHLIEPQGYPKKHRPHLPWSHMNRKFMRHRSTLYNHRDYIEVKKVDKVVAEELARNLKERQQKESVLQQMSEQSLGTQERNIMMGKRRKAQKNLDTYFLQQENLKRVKRQSLTKEEIQERVDDLREQEEEDRLVLEAINLVKVGTRRQYDERVHAGKEENEEIDRQLLDRQPAQDEAEARKLDNSMSQALSGRGFER